MPRVGGKVAPEELGLISAWINAGAKFDGTDSAAPLTSFSPSKKNDDKGDKLNVVTATGKEEVQFARDLGAIFLTHCFECHGQRNPRNNFSVETFNRLLRGGDGGVVLAPGKPDESLLVKKLRGMAGERMPLNLPPLGADEIAKFEKWIASGAKFDGSDPGSPLQEIVDLSAAERATHAELSERRVELAAKNWRLILPDSKPQQEEAADVLVYGSVSPELLAGVTRTAEEQVAKLRKQFKVPVDRPLIKGRLTLYVFEKRYDYGEVGTMLEHRELPAVWRGHWHYNPLDAYGCVLLDSEGHASPGLVAQQIAGAYVASLGKIPRWFAEGSARAVAAAVNRKDPRVVAWDENVARIYTASERPDSFLTGNLPPEEADILSYSFVKFLKTSNSRYDALMAALASGTSFAEAFPKAYGGSPTDQIAIWSSRAVKRAR